MDIAFEYFKFWLILTQFDWQKVTWPAIASQQARKFQSYASLKLRLTDPAWQDIQVDTFSSH